MTESGGGGAGCFPAVGRPCDVKLRGLTPHERVWMCEVCEQSPASVTCKADAAALCVTCDRDIHSANPLARRHKRIPVVPFYDSAAAGDTSAAGTVPNPGPEARCDKWNSSVTNEDNINWGIPSNTSSAELKSIEMLLSNTDRLFDFGFSDPTDDAGLQSQFHNPGNDSVVPVQPPPSKQIPPAQVVDNFLPESSYEIDFTRSKINPYQYSYPDQSFSHSVSSSSIDVGVVPERNAMSDVSYPFLLPGNGGVELDCETNETRKTTSLSATDRKARVLRYIEKRKNRKFEKTIRYASRKAYAESRPRIKGRFTKRKETAELVADRWLFPTVPSSLGGVSYDSYSGDAEYGVVPSF